MVRVKARIKLFEGTNKRQTPFTSGYRPLFKFIEETMTSGQISLINQKQFSPGEEGIVEIAFLNKGLLGGDFRIGKRFNFYESEEPLGEGEILEIQQ